MSHQSDLIQEDILAYLAQHEKKELLRFLTCGNVDDGKSTLIGRLLYDSQSVYDDQIHSVEKASRNRNAGPIDFSQAGLFGCWLQPRVFDVDKVVAASPGIELKTAPEGYVKLHENHHLWSKTRIGQIQKNGQFKVVYESDLIEPNPFPKGYQ